MKKRSLLKTMLLLCALIVGYGSAWGQVTIWSENFNGLAADATPTAPTNTAYTGVTYTCTDGTGTSPGSTKIMNETLAGGASAPEMMVGKKGSGDGATGGKFTAVIPLDNIEGTLTLTYYQNKQTLKVSSTTTGVSGGQTLKPSAVGQQTTTFTGITPEMTSITIVFESTTTSNVRLDDIVLTGYKASSVATPTFSPAGGTYTSAQAVSISTTTEGATIRYTTNGSEPTTSSTTYAMPIYVGDNITIKAIAIKGSDVSPVATATYTILPVEHAGTVADPYTVADARNAIDANSGVNEVYATGIVSEIVTAYNSEYKNITFNISTDGTTTSNQLQAFRCKKGDGDGDPDVSDIQVGDVVVIKGNLKKYNDTYEFDQNNVLVSRVASTTPLITVTPTSLTDFTYEVAKGPSAAQEITVSGQNLSDNITVSLGESSNFEISETENSGYTNSLTLTQTTGAVAETTIYVRLKAGLAVKDSYEGTITLTSAGAENVEVSLSGSVTAPESPNVTWDLSKDQTATATTTEMTWTSSYATMGVAKGTASTATNNYYPGTTGKKYTSTRFYSGSSLTITPANGYIITSVVFTATSVGYANALQGSTWTNATAAVNGTTVTVTPINGTAAFSATIGGTCGFTSVKVFYTESPLTIYPAKEYTTYVTQAALNFTGVEGLEAYIATAATSSAVTIHKVTEAVPAGTPLILKKVSGTSFNVPVVASATAPEGNLLVAGPATLTGDGTEYILVDGTFYQSNAGALAAGKAYLKLSAPLSAPQLALSFDGEGTTAIDEVRSKTEEVREGIFDLSGRRVEKPTKGLYIVNGKKVIIK